MIPSGVLMLFSSGLVCWALCEAEHTLVRVALLTGITVLWMAFPSFAG